MLLLLFVDQPEDNVCKNVVLLLYASKEMIVLNKYLFKVYGVSVFQYHFHYWKQISFY